MKNLLLLILISVLFSACSKSIIGTVTAPTTYTSPKKSGENYTYAVFNALSSNSPAAVMDKNGQTFYLNIAPSILAAYAMDEIKVKGQLSTNGCVLQAQKIWVKKDKKWVIIPF